jgi:outer membrane receptor protein involved in Fe transport
MQRPFSILVLALWLVPAALAQALPVLEGRLLGAEDGQPVAGAEVRILETGATAISDREGRWVFRELAPGCWHLRTAHLAFRPLEQEVCLATAGTRRVELVLQTRVLELPEARVRARAGHPEVIFQERGRSRLDLEGGEGQDLAALVARLPGLSVIRQGGAGAAVTVSVDGCAPREVLVCIDGVPLNAGGDRAVDLGRLDPGPLAAVELQRGADPSRGALAGTLNLVTRQGGHPRQRLDGELTRPASHSLALGLQTLAGGDLWESSARLQQGHGRYPYTDPQDGSLRTRSNVDARREALSLGWQPEQGPLSRVALAGHWREAGIGDRIDLSDPWLLRERERNLGLQAQGRARAGRGSRLWLQQDRRRTWGWPWGGQLEQESRLGLELHHDPRPGSLNLAPGARLGLGAVEYRADDGNRRERARRLELRPVASVLGPRLAVDGGAQLWHDEEGLHGEPVLRLDWQPIAAVPTSGRGITVRLAASRGPRLPSFMERFPVGGAQVQGNTGLKPERHQELRLGLEAAGGPVPDAGATRRGRIRGQLEFLQRESRDLIVWRQSQAAAWKPFNLGRSRVRQWHARLDLDLSARWGMVGEGQWRDPRNLAPGINHGRYLPHVPLSAWNTRLEWHSHPGAWKGQMALKAEGAGRSYSGESNLEGLDGAALDPWWVLGVEAGFERNLGRTRWGGNLVLENLLDRQVRQVPKVPLPGRGFRVGLWLGVS